MLDAWPIPVLSENYVWVVARPGGRQVLVVDPGDAAPVEAALAARGLVLDAVLVTHHHADHVAGASELARGTLPVYGPSLEHVAAVDHPVQDGDRITVAGLDLEVVHVPGHTRGHVAYVAPGLLLCGDTLFAGGCGRLFEGTAEEMWTSLCRLRSLPADTRVCCGHEYTVANLRFAEVVEPDNVAIRERLQSAVQRRKRGESTLPSRLVEELETNPFLRADLPSVVEAARRRCGRPVAPGGETFAVVRRWKDDF